MIVLAACLVGAPVVFAGIWRGAAPLRARAAALPACTIVGTNGPDRIVGSAGRDVICARGGDDVVEGGGGNDVIFGGAGDDRLAGSRGNDRLYGGVGRDRLSGGQGDDFLQGAGGADVISGGAGSDTVDYAGRRGAVRVTLGHGANDGARGEGDDVRGDVENVNGGAGADVLVGDSKANVLRGNGGNDRLDGGGGNDRLYGGAGRDRLAGRDGGHFVDRLDCGNGRDRALADSRDHVRRNCERIVRSRRPNHAPSDIVLSNARVAENQPAGTTVGTLTAVDRDRGEPHTFALAAGGADNASFRVDGFALKTNAVFDFETKRSYSIRIRVTDRSGASFTKDFTIAVIDLPEHVDHPPTDITLSHSSVEENKPAGTTVGDLSAADPDAGDTATFTLAAGGTDNASFRIDGSTLKTNAVFDFETKSSYSIRVRATDAAGAAFEKQFTITVNDVNDPPVADPKAVTGVAEDGSKTITLSGSDGDGDTLTFHVASPQHGQIDTATPAATCDAQTPSHCTTSVTYTPDADFNGSDSFGYTVNDGASGSTNAVVAITVDPVDDAPVASDGDVTGDEDAAFTVDLGALVSDVETSDANLTYTIVSAPGHGTLSGSGPSETYTPAANFNGSDSFTYTVSDRGDPDGCSGGPPACDAPLSSATKTVSITVAPVNDAPVAADASPNVDEDHQLAVDLSALASDVETSDANLTYTIASGPAHGTLTGAGASRTYTPDPDFDGADSFTYTVTDRGDPDNCGAVGPGCTAAKTSTTATVSIAVNAVNDAPVNTVPAGPISPVSETDTPIRGVSVADVDAGGQSVQVTLSALHGTLTVSTSVALGVGPLEVTGNGSKTVVVTAPISALNTTFADANGVVYHSDAAYTGPDTLTVSTDDLGNTGSGGPLTDTDTVALTVVAPDNAPVAAAQRVTTSEDTAKAITLSATDADGDDPLSFAIGTPPAHGSLGSIGAVTCDHATPNTCTAGVTYTPAADYNGSDSFTFTAGDGLRDSAPATVSITVNAINDAPTLQNIEAGALGYTENDSATQITATTTVSDVDSANFDTGTLTVDYSAGGTVDDRLAIANQGTGAGQIGVSGANVTYGATTIGTFTGGSGTTPLIVTLNASADAAAVQALVRAITYRNVSDSPTASRTARFVLTDGDGGTSAPATRAISVTAVNDPPALAGIESAAVAYAESVDAAPTQSQVTNTLTVVDPDNGNLAGAVVQITGACKPSEDVLVFSNGNGITGTYTASTCRLALTGSASLAVYQAALRSIKYEDTSDTPDTTTRTVTFSANDGSADSNTPTRDITVTAANDSPTAAADTYSGSNSALAGVTLAVGTSPTDPHVSVSGGVLSNDTDPDTPNTNLTASAGTTSAHGGVVAMNSDGTFTYTPAAGFTGSDSFTYTVHDHGTPDRTATGTVTINVAGPRVWFVSPGGTAGDGTSRAPLASLAPLSTGGSSDSLDGSGDVIFVYQGTGNAASGGFVLEGNQQLVGQPQGLSVTNANGTYDLVTAGGSNPTITNGGGAGLTLADGNTVQRVDVKSATGVGVTGSGVSTLTYGSNTTISGNAGGGLALSGAAGGTVSIGAAITTTAGHSVSIANRTSGTTTLSGAINDTGTGISLTSNTGATINLTGGVIASTGANAAFTATGGGTVSVTGTANTLATTTATALNVANTTIGASGLNFQKISSNGGSSTGIILDGTGSTGGLTVSGTGTAASGGTIANKTGADGSTTAGIGIYLNNTKSPSFARMQLNDFQNFAVRGTGVDGFTLSDSTVNGSNGTSTAADEASVALDNLTGSGSITNDNISGGVEDDVRIQNATGSLSSLSITGSTFATTGAGTANDALALLGRSGATVFNATVQNNTFTRAQGDLFQYTLVTGTGTMHFDANTVTNNFPTTLPAGGGDINVSSASTASATQSLQYSINNNSIYSSGTGGQPPNGSVIVVAATPQGSATGTIQNNLIGTTGVTQSGGFDSILADAVKAGFHKVTITGNTIRRYKETGIRLLGVSPAAQPGYNIRATVKGNTITEPDSVAFAGIDAEVGADPSDIGAMCLDLGGTSAADKNSVSTGDPNNFNDINILQQFATGIDLPGYGGAATNDAAVEAFVAARNDGNGAPTVFAGHDTTTADGNPAGTGFTGTGTDCS